MATVDQMVEVLTWSEGKAESVVKVVKFLKEGVQLYSSFSGRGLETPSNDAGDQDAKRDILLQQFARQWTILPTDVRKDLIEPVRAEAGGNAAHFFNTMLNQMAAAVLMQLPVAKLGVMVGQVLKNQLRILNELETINSRLSGIERRLDEMVMRQARVGVIHLHDAANVQSESARERKLHLAEHVFTELIALDPNKTTAGTSGSYQNRALITLGYWGRHLSLGLQGEMRYALVQVYQCVLNYPMEGFAVFPPAYFTKDYKAQLDLAKVNWAMAQSNVQAAAKAKQSDDVTRTVEAAGKYLLGLSGMAAGVLTLNPSVFQAGLQGLNWASEERPDTGVTSGLHYALGAEARMKQIHEDLSASVRAECQWRLEFLERIKVKDLSQFMITPANPV